jgi:Fe-S-cluster containining protein
MTVKPGSDRRAINCAKCTHCGFCCRRWDIYLSKQDIRKLVKAGYRPEGFMAFMPQPILRMRGKRGDCVFLNERNLCIIQTKYGYESKPQACRDYPKHTAKELAAENDYFFYELAGKLVTRDVVISLLRSLSGSDHREFFDRFSEGLLAVEAQRSGYIDTFNFDPERRPLFSSLKAGSISSRMKRWESRLSKEDLHGFASLPPGGFDQKRFIGSLQKMIEKNQLLYPGLTEKLLRFFYMMEMLGRAPSNEVLLNQLDKFNRKYM